MPFVYKINDIEFTAPLEPVFDLASLRDYLDNLAMETAATFPALPLRRAQELLNDCPQFVIPSPDGWAFGPRQIGILINFVDYLVQYHTRDCLKLVEILATLLVTMTRPVLATIRFDSEEGQLKFNVDTVAAIREYKEKYVKPDLN